MYDKNGHEIVIGDSAIATSKPAGRKFAGTIVAISSTHPKVLLRMTDFSRYFHPSRVVVQLNDDAYNEVNIP